MTAMAEYIEREASVKAFNNFDAGRADSSPCMLRMAEHGKYCPIMVAGANTHVSLCIGKDCAWWLPYANDCALPVVAGILADSTITRLERAYAEIREMRAADVAPVVHGKWGDNGIAGSMLVKCSVCGFDCGANSFSYCPNCGAKMDGGNEGE